MWCLHCSWKRQQMCYCRFSAVLTQSYKWGQLWAKRAQQVDDQFSWSIWSRVSFFLASPSVSSSDVETMVEEHPRIGRMGSDPLQAADQELQQLSGRRKPMLVRWGTLWFLFINIFALFRLLHTNEGCHGGSRFHIDAFCLWIYCGCWCWLALWCILVITELCEAQTMRGQISTRFPDYNSSTFEGSNPMTSQSKLRRLM